MPVQSEWLRYLRYAVIVLSSAVALWSLLGLMRRSINVEAFLKVAAPLVTTNPTRLAKLASAGGSAALSQLVLFALALRVPIAEDTTSESSHFRATNERATPYELRWKRSLDRAFDRLRRELSLALGLSVGGLCIAAITASLGALMTADKHEFIRMCLATTLLMMFMFGAANAGRSALLGLAKGRAFCDRLRVADEQRDAARIEACSIAERALRAEGRALDANGALAP